MQIVWFKRDLRVHDHRPLNKAVSHGDVLPLYVAEPALWRQPDMSGRQWAFIAEALQDLRDDLTACGQPLVVRTGNMVQVLAALSRHAQIDGIWSHEETGNDWTFKRDQQVLAWCRAQGIRWTEIRNHGVQRRLSSRNGWAGNWDSFMAETLTPAPTLKPIEIDIGRIPNARDLGLEADLCYLRQIGGRQKGLDLLDSFLKERGEQYSSAMSSPISGERACSRLSPHLAWGTVSMRESAQRTWDQQRAIKVNSGIGNAAWRASLKSFNGRLHWHCHFIQKLEDEPRLELQNIHRKYDGIRPSAPDQELLAAWANGETGLPFVDACMRYLRATGWLNFRMRSMVMATASYHLWLDWRAPGLQLAQYFTDYEPGIHWSQVQMQSGTTGINTIRIYNPVKQGYDQDPTGAFTRKWVPELAEIPDKFLHEPWHAENARDVLGKTYPERVVDHLAAAKEARERIWAVRRSADFRTEASAVVAKHASRKGTARKRTRLTRKYMPDQMTLPFGDHS